MQTILRLPARLHGVHAHALALPRRFSTRLSGAALDAEIAAMNAEMEDLFGSPVGDASHTQAYEPATPAPAAPNSNSLPVASARHVQNGSQPEGVAAARVQLLTTITMATNELSSSASAAILDVDRCTRLATCISECARAIAELERIDR